MSAVISRVATIVAMREPRYAGGVTIAGEAAAFDGCLDRDVEDDLAGGMNVRLAICPVEQTTCAVWTQDVCKCVSGIGMCALSGAGVARLGLALTPPQQTSSNGSACSFRGRRPNASLPEGRASGCSAGSC